MICPKCGFEQPDNPECMRCGVIVGRYRGPVVAAASIPSPVSAPLPPPPVMAASVAAGTLYDGPVPTPAAEGTVYQGPAPGAVTGQAGRGAVPIARRLQVGEILSETFSIYFKNFIPFTLLTALAFAPIFLLAGFLGQEVAAKSPVAALNAMLVMLLTLMLCIPISTAAITYGVFQQMRGRETSLVDCIRVGLSSLLPVLSVAFLQIVAVFGAFILTLIPVAFLIAGAVAAVGKSSGAGGGCGALVIMLPILLSCYIFPIMVWLKLFVVVPAAVEERLGPLDALRRSSFLTAGQRWPIFGLVFVLGILNLGVNLVAGFVPEAGKVIGPLLALVMCGIFSASCAVVYYRLRSSTESIDVDQISSVFA
jgi:hypothetical protein